MNGVYIKFFHAGHPYVRVWLPLGARVNRGGGGDPDRRRRPMTADKQQMTDDRPT
jgi:hypothetical protein